MLKMQQWKFVLLWEYNKYLFHNKVRWKFVLEKFINDIKNAQSDKDIKKVLCDFYAVIQVDSKVRQEFDRYLIEVNK